MSAGLYRRAMAERDLQQAVKDAAQMLGWLGYHKFRIWKRSCDKIGITQQGRSGAGYTLRRGPQTLEV